jgi:hypothetical protein
VGSGQWQMAIYSTLVGLIGIGSFAYVLVTKPAYLHATRNGVPYFTPHVINPAGGDPLDVNDLVRNYKGQDK